MRRKKLSKIAAVSLAFTLCVGSLAGCGKKDEKSGEYLDEPVPVMDDAMAALRYGVEGWRKAKDWMVQKGNDMAKARHLFGTEERIEQLKKCCETICDNAEEIMKSFDCPVERTITIHFNPNEVPVIEINQKIISKKMLESL